MEKLKAKRAWAVCYDPNYLIQMGEEYDDDRLEQLNEHLAKGDYTLISNDTQGFPGDLVIDFPLNMAEPYRALILLEAI
jgi:hypothetical protein